MLFVLRKTGSTLDASARSGLMGTDIRDLTRLDVDVCYNDTIPTVRNIQAVFCVYLHTGRNESKRTVQPLKTGPLQDKVSRGFTVR